MTSPDHEMRYLQACIEEIEQYLLSTEVYWHIGILASPGERPFPQLTLGSLMLTRMRARALAPTMNATQRAQLAHLEEAISSARARWRTNWGMKAANEFHARLLLWRDFLEEYRTNPEENSNRYAYEVQRRVQLHILSWDATQLPQAEFDLLSGLDLLLHAVFIPGEFIWETNLAVSFPPENFWYLYGHLRKSA
jgi:hypothetical protein